jgi:colicin import membrane protein
LILDKYNIIPITMAMLLHGLFVSSLLFVFKFPSSAIATPLAIEATLVTAESLETQASPVVTQPDPEPEIIPEPEPEIDVPDVPDEAEEERVAAEEQMRLEELAVEQLRLHDIEVAEQKKRDKEAADKRVRDDAELERKRVAAEKKRLEDIERQRKENERLRAQALEKEADELRVREIAEEDARLAAMNSGAMAAYQFALQQKIMRNWIAPASALPGIECVVDVRQLPGGDVVSARVGRCNGDDAVRRSIEAAVFKAAPLPEPSDPSLFQRDLRITFKPEE